MVKKFGYFEYLRNFSLNEVIRFSENLNDVELIVTTTTNSLGTIGKI